MWTTIVAALLAGWIMYYLGIVVETARRDDDDEANEAERETLERKLTAAQSALADTRASRSRWRAAAVQLETTLERERDLSRRLMDRVLPAIPDDVGEPLTVGEADRLAVQERRRALEREAAMEYDGREPVPITDDEAEPPPRLAREEDDGDAP